MTPRGRGAGWDPPHPPRVLLGGPCRGRKRSACASDREKGRKPSKARGAGRGAGWRPAVARRWPVASRRTWVGGVGSKAMLLLSLQGSVDGWTSSSRGGPRRAAPRRAARPARQGRGATVFCVAFRVVPKSSSSSALRRPLQAWLSMQAGPYGAGGRTHNTTCYLYRAVLRKFTEENTVQHATLRTCSVS